MRVWLWDAGTRLGITDNETRAMLAATDALRDGDSATVELAIATIGFLEPSAIYLRTGRGWTARTTGAGIAWFPLLPERTASRSPIMPESTDPGPTPPCCSCGFAACDADELTDHLLGAFALANDTAPDGTLHAEAARNSAAGPRRCLCGHQAGDLDRHFLSVFTPHSATATDGTRHVPLP
jgi:hypothetical protein